MQVRCTFEVAQLCLIATAKSTCTERKDPKIGSKKWEEKKPLEYLKVLQDGPEYFAPFKLLRGYSDKMAYKDLAAKRLQLLKSIRFLNSFCTSALFF